MRMFTHEDINAILHAPADTEFRITPPLDDRITAAVQMVKDRDPGIITLIDKLSSKGSEPARQASLLRFSKTIHVLDSYLNGEHWAEIMRSYEDATDAFSPDQRWKITYDWHLNNVAVDAGEFFYLGMHGFPDLLHSEDTDQSDVFWRGLAAIHIISDSIQGISLAADLLISSHRDFIHWAGAHADVGQIVRIAKERSTLDLNTVKSLLAAQETSLPLGAGAL